VEYKDAFLEQSDDFDMETDDEIDDDNEKRKADGSSQKVGFAISLIL